MSSEFNDSDSTEDDDHPYEEWYGIEDSEGDEEPPAGLVAEIEVNPKPATGKPRSRLHFVQPLNIKKRMYPPIYGKQSWGTTKVQRL